MEEEVVEPDLIRIFRLFAGAEAAALILISGFDYLVQGEITRQLEIRFFPNLAGSVLLFVYLSMPWLGRKLKNSYLQIALVIATITPIISTAMAFEDSTGQNPFGVIIEGWMLTPLLFVPLVIIAWQYRLRSVVLFCLFMGFLDISLTLEVAERISLEVLPGYAMIIIRTTSLFVVGFIVNRLMKTQRQQKKALTNANMRLSLHVSMMEQLATSRERNRLARELHDTLAHTLSGLAVQLEATRTVLNPAEQETHRMLQQSLTTTRAGLTETRRALRDLRATPLDDLGLCMALKNLSQTVAERSNIKIDTRIVKDVGNLSLDLEQGIYRIAQEALENTIRHAGASRVLVYMGIVDGILILEIDDNGRGFDSGEALLREKLGIKGMQERAEMLGGKLEVFSSREQGTTVRFSMEL
jgi:signal transduction histidine kinase